MNEKAHSFTMVVPEQYYSAAERIAAEFGFNSPLDVFRAAVGYMLGEPPEGVDWNGVRAASEDRINEIRRATTAYIWKCRKARMKKDA